MQVEAPHSKEDRRVGIITTIVIHGVILALLIWLVIPVSDPPPGAAEGAGIELGLEGLEGEGVSGEMGAGGIPPTEDNSTPPPSSDQSPNEDQVLTNPNEDNNVVVEKKKESSKTKNNQVKNNSNKEQIKKDNKNQHVNPFAGFYGPGKDGSGTGNGTDGKGQGSGDKGNGLSDKGFGPDAAGNGIANRTGASGNNFMLNETHNCPGASTQVVKVIINKSGKVTSATGNQPGTTNNGSCFKLQAEAIARKFTYNSDPQAIEKREKYETIYLSPAPNN